MVQKLTISKTHLGRVQYLTEVLPQISTNTMLYKTLTGLGATYSELKTARNSIIIEPNKPVISGKCNDPRHAEDNVLGVFEGVYTEDITDYLEETQAKGRFIKIMTTPESFNKVRRAFEELDMDIRFSCFLLFDECHKIVKDVDYRNTISLPMGLFFQCKQKALVSATPLQFTDPRFATFNTIEIVPDFDYSKDITLHTTNNVLQTMRELLKHLDNEHIFIFCNSTDNIFSMMEQLNLLQESAVFCSQKSVDKLRELKFREAHEIWNPEYIRKYNWLTSRFYNAVDIELDEQPAVVLFTDSYFTEYTCFDPYTDAVQCVGRFRNGVAEIHHVANTNSKFRIATFDTMKGFVECSEHVYNQLETLRVNATTQPAKEAYAVAIERLPYTQWLNPDKSVNHFLIDNFMDEEIVKGYYNNKECLLAHYEQCRHFNVLSHTYTYKLGDLERLRRYNKTISVKENRRIIVEQLEMLGECETELDFSFKREISLADKFIVEAYDKIGKAEIERLRYNPKKIKEAMIVADYKEKAKGTEVLQLVKNSFKEGQWYDSKFIKKELKRILDLFNVKPPKAVSSHTITDFFDAAEQRKSKQRGYFLIRCKTI